MKRKITVSVGIPAYNEGKNILQLLRAILKQKQLSFTLQEIIVASDGSNDNTVQQVKELHNKKIKVLQGNKRLGQNRRVNDILKNSRGDIVVIVEADTLPCSKNTLEKLIKPFLSNSSQLVVVGSWTEIKAKTTYEQLIQFGNNLKMQMFKNWENGSNVYLHGGHSVKAFSKKMKDTFRFPLDVPDDAYLYLYCKSNNVFFKYLPGVKMVFKNVSNMEDRIKQSKKFLEGQVSLKKYFNEDYINKEYNIPKILVLKSFLHSFITNPLFVLLFLLDILINRLLNLNIKSFNPQYDIYGSSKELKI